MAVASAAALLLVGFVLIAVAVAAVLLQLRAPESGAATAPADRSPTDRSLKLTVPAMKRVQEVPVFDAADDDESALPAGTTQATPPAGPKSRSERTVPNVERGRACA